MPRAGETGGKCGITWYRASFGNDDYVPKLMWGQLHNQTIVGLYSLLYSYAVDEHKAVKRMRKLSCTDIDASPGCY